MLTENSARLHCKVPNKQSNACLAGDEATTLILLLREADNSLENAFIKEPMFIHWTDVAGVCVRVCVCVRVGV